MQVIFGRMFIASLCLCIFIPSFRKLNWRRRDLKYLLIMAVCEPCLYFIFEAKALELTSASQAGMITAMLPLLVAILAWGLLKEQITRQTLAGFRAGDSRRLLAESGQRHKRRRSQPDARQPQ